MTTRHDRGVRTRVLTGFAFVGVLACASEPVEPVREERALVDDYEGCAVDDDCKSGICHERFLVCLPHPCDVAADCASGEVCVTTRGMPGNRCDRPAAHGDGCFFAGAEGDVVTHPCAFDLACEPTSGGAESDSICVPRERTRAPGEPCSGFRCDDGLVCSDVATGAPVCGAPADAACVNDAQCASGVCVAGSCAP
jgi:hypothetical protein